MSSSSFSTEGVVCFHPFHGENISLLEDRRRALRRVSFEKALVFSDRPLRPFEPFFVSIETVEGGWTGHLRIGLTRLNPDTRPPASELSASSDSWLLSVSPFSLVDSPSSSSTSALPTDVGSRVGVYYAPDGPHARLHLVLNGLDVSPAHPPISLDDDLYAVVDVFGNTKEVRISPVLRTPDRLCSLCTRQVSALLHSPSSGLSHSLHRLPPQLRSLFPVDKP